MKAFIRPLSGKYYGTQIELMNEVNEDTVINIWHMGDGSPSIRELNKAEITQKEWDEDKLESPRELWFGGTTSSARECMELCDSHYESRDGYNLAKFICEKINTEYKEKIKSV